MSDERQHAALFCRPRRLPNQRRRRRLSVPCIALAVAFFVSPDLQSPEMFPERIPYQGGTIPPRPPCALVGSLEESLVENNLNSFHMLILFHTCV